MKISAFKILAGCLHVAMVAGLAVHRRAIVQAGAANASLLDQATTTAPVVTEIIQTDEIVQLEQANRDLPKLRNAVRTLREEKRELDRLASENERLATAIKTTPRSNAPRLSEAEGFVLREKWSNAGFGTPEATVQTFFWAITQRNAKRLA